MVASIYAGSIDTRSVTESSDSEHQAESLLMGIKISESMTVCSGGISPACSLLFSCPIESSRTDRMMQTVELHSYKEQS